MGRGSQEEDDEKREENGVREKAIGPLIRLLALVTNLAAEMDDDGAKEKEVLKGVVKVTLAKCP